eukprot:1191179-Prorocentrum_minimum.AAC.2
MVLSEAHTNSSAGSATSLPPTLPSVTNQTSSQLSCDIQAGQANRMKHHDGISLVHGVMGFGGTRSRTSTRTHDSVAGCQGY